MSTPPCPHCQETAFRTITDLTTHIRWKCPVLIDRRTNITDRRTTHDAARASQLRRTNIADRRTP